MIFDLWSHQSCCCSRCAPLLNYGRSRIRRTCWNRITFHIFLISGRSSLVICCCEVLKIAGVRGEAASSGCGGRGRFSSSTQHQVFDFYMGFGASSRYSSEKPSPWVFVHVWVTRIIRLDPSELSASQAQLSEWLRGVVQRILWSLDKFSFILAWFQVSMRKDGLKIIQSCLWFLCR